MKYSIRVLTCAVDELVLKQSGQVNNLRSTFSLTYDVGFSKNDPLCYCPYLHKKSTDFQNSFTGTFAGQ